MPPVFSTVGSFCSDNCEVCLKEVDKREYFNLRWQKNEDGYSVCSLYRENVGCN